MKTRVFVMSMAAAALVMTACSNDETDNWNGEIRLTSGLTVQQTDTRAATGIQNDQFISDEEIDVFISENVAPGGTATTTYAQPLTYTAGGDGTMNPPSGSQPYFPTSGNGVNIHAVHPSGASATFSVEADQSGSDGASYRASDLMYGAPAQNPVARTSSQVNLTFKHLLSKVTVTLKAGSGAPSLVGATVKLKEVLPATPFNSAEGTIGSAEGTKTDITVMKVSGGNLSGSAIAVPQALATTFIEVTLANGGVLTSKDLKDGSGNSINSVVLTGGNEFKYEITVNLTSLDITSSITPWTPNSNSGNAEMQ